MGMLSGLLGHAVKTNIASLQSEFQPFMVEGEELLAAYKLIRDQFVFSNKRLILVNKQGVTGTKVEYLSIPYTRIVGFAKESAGLLDLDAELKIWIVGQSQPIVREFKKDQNINEVYLLLSKAILE